MNQLGIDRAMMWPTLASLLEERLADDPVATHVVVHALNQWMHETWSFDYEGRIFATPIVTLPIVERAIEELEWVLARGARAILVRPAPVPGFGGRRSFALPEFDPFWKRVEQADVLVGMHASDSGYQRYLNDWEGIHDREFLPFQGGSGFAAIVGSEHRAIVDAMASLVGHGLLSRFPRLKIAPIENGSHWVRPLLHSMEHAFKYATKSFAENPVDVFLRNVYVHPFHEEDPVGLVKLLGSDNVLFGSDYPHPEGLADPLAFVDELAALPCARRREGDGRESRAADEDARGEGRLTGAFSTKESDSFADFVTSRLVSASPKLRARTAGEAWELQRPQKGGARCGRRASDDDSRRAAHRGGQAASLPAGFFLQALRRHAR